MNNIPPAVQNTSQPASLLGDTFDLGWRAQFVAIILRIACVAGIGFLLLSFPSATNAGRILFISIYLVLVALTVFKIPNLIRTLGLLIMIFMAGAYSVLVWGPWGAGSLVLGARRSQVSRRVF